LVQCQKREEDIACIACRMEKGFCCLEELIRAAAGVSTMCLCLIALNEDGNNNSPRILLLRALFTRLPFWGIICGLWAASRFGKRKFCDFCLFDVAKQGTLSKSSPCGDLWCLDLYSWEWTNVKAAGPMPDPGTYVLTPLDGESGSELVCIGSKVDSFVYVFFFSTNQSQAFEDTRNVFHVLYAPSDDPKSAVWSKGQFPAKYKPSVAEGMSCLIANNHLVVIGGRPGDVDKDHVDLCVIPREVFVLERKIAPIPVVVASPKNARKSVSNSAIKRNATSKTVSARTAVKKDDVRAMFQFSDSDMMAAVRDSVNPRVSISVGNKDAIASPEALSPRNEQTDLREVLTSLQQNFEREVSVRLDVESQAQRLFKRFFFFFLTNCKSLATDYAALKEAYALLQAETKRLYQLAMSEVTIFKKKIMDFNLDFVCKVTTAAGREKLERRYDELRASSEIAVVNDASKLPAREKSLFFQTMATGKGATTKKDKLLELHLHCVEKINLDANKMLRPITTVSPTASTGAISGVPVPAGVGVTPQQQQLVAQTAQPQSPVTVAKTSKALPVPPRKPVVGEALVAAETVLLSPRESGEDSVSPGRAEMEAARVISELPTNIADIWLSRELTAEFEMYVRHEHVEHFANVLFCEAVWRLIHSPISAHSALIEVIVSDHLVSEAEFLATGLDIDMRDSMVTDANTTWIDSPPSMSYWNTVLILVEVKKKKFFL
jgi:hypothetical protein